MQSQIIIFDGVLSVIQCGSHCKAISKMIQNSAIILRQQFTIVHHGSIILQHHPNLIPESQNVDYGLHIGLFTTHIIVINCKKEIGFALRARNLVLELPSAQVRCLLSVSFTSFIPLCFYGHYPSLFLWTQISLCFSVKDLIDSPSTELPVSLKNSADLSKCLFH